MGKQIEKKNEAEGLNGGRRPIYYIVKYNITWQPANVEISSSEQVIFTGLASVSSE